MATRKRGAEPLDLATPKKSSRFLIDQLLEVEEDDAESASTEPPVVALPLPGCSPLLVRVECRLETRELWKKFFDLPTEMIITKSGRRMFPTVKVALSGCDQDALYYVLLDVVAVDNRRYRYIYNKSAWLPAGKAEPAPRTRLYMHPDSPFSGEQVVSFEKAKLTNNEVDKAGHLILNSMHKYQPRVHVVRRARHLPLDQTNLNAIDLHNEHYKTFEFVETQFMAVTAYQNQLVTKLKIEKNPFAKGFRDPSGRSPDFDLSGESSTSLLPTFLPPTMVQQAFFNQYLLGKLPCRAPVPMLSPLIPFAFSAPPSLLHFALSSSPSDSGHLLVSQSDDRAPSPP